MANGIEVAREVQFFVQRLWISAEGVRHWVDASPTYYAEPGDEQPVLETVIEARDAQREIFGKRKVRIARREIVTTETVIE